MDVINGGKDPESSGGTPTSLADRAEEDADAAEMLCDRSLHRISPCTSPAVRVFCEAIDESKSSSRYRIEMSGKRKAALMKFTSTGGSTDFNAAAKVGLVDQTIDDSVGERGRKAIGPVGRKR